MTGAVIDRFFRPFFGSVFLDPELTTSELQHEFVFRMFSSVHQCPIIAYDRLAFRRDLEFEKLENGFRVKTRAATDNLTGQPYLGDLGRLIATGRETVSSIRDLVARHAVEYLAINRTLRALVYQAILEATAGR